MTNRKPWRTEWQRALYGDGGFYHGPGGPAAHFTTSAHGLLGKIFAEAIVALVDRHGCTSVVDIGCGRGELLTEVHNVRPELQLTGLDVVERPDDLPLGIGWLCSPGGAELPAELTGLTDVLVVANEWLDVVPCTIAQVDEFGWLRQVEVGEDGSESLGGLVAAEELAWADEWWQDRHPGDRVEIGLSRDNAWRDLVSRVERGVVLAIDYGHVKEDRPLGGTLIGYASGHTVAPIPDGSCDLTAHVSMDSLEAMMLTQQRDAFQSLGILPERPNHELATSDPRAYLYGLARQSAISSLIDPQVLGSFWWARTLRV